MTNCEKRRWERRYRDRTRQPKQDPAPTLGEFVDTLPSGRALDIATGQGRNALFLADHGWAVDAIDISRAALLDARDRARTRSLSIDWILADVDDYCFPDSHYDVVTISNFDARHRLPSVKASLAPGGALVYDHHLQRQDTDDGPGNRYRFESNELRDACSDLHVRHYEEDHDRNRVSMVVSQSASK